MAIFERKPDGTVKEVADIFTDINNTVKQIASKFIFDKEGVSRTIYEAVKPLTGTYYLWKSNSGNIGVRNVVNSYISEGSGSLSRESYCYGFSVKINQSPSTAVITFNLGQKTKFTKLVYTNTRYYCVNGTYGSDNSCYIQGSFVSHSDNVARSGTLGFSGGNLTNLQNGGNFTVSFRMIHTKGINGGLMTIGDLAVQS